jgi:hypothetical protein
MDLSAKHLKDQERPFVNGQTASEIPNVWEMERKFHHV